MAAHAINIFATLRDRAEAEAADFPVEHDQHDDRLQRETGQSSSGDPGFVKPRECQRDFHRGVYRDGYHRQDHWSHRVVQGVICHG